MCLREISVSRHHTKSPDRVSYRCTCVSNSELTLLSMRGRHCIFCLALFSMVPCYADKSQRAVNTETQERATIAKPLTEKQKKKREERLRKELETPYRKWLSEDVLYIISDEERAAFKRLSTDDEREQFIEQFWLRRDPTPDNIENEFKEEHYRRIAYANERLSSGFPGWKTDRGRIYIKY